MSWNQYPDEYSTPPTPRDFPQWEVLDQQQHQPQAQGSQLPQQDVLQPSPLTPSHTPLYAQHLQLDQQEQFVPSQASPVDDLEIRLHPLSQPPVVHDSSAEASSSRGGPTLRTSPPRTRAQQRMHPYTRPETAAGGPSSNTRQRQHQQQQRHTQSPIRFIQQLPPPPIITRPTTRRSSPLASTSATREQAHPLPQAPSSRLLAIRLDWRYDPVAQTLTAYLEMPGVKREDIRVTLSTCFYNRTKQVTVTASRLPPFPGAVSSRDAIPGREFFWIEGKYGECRRSLTVSAECKPDDIEARLEDGLLLLRINCGPPDDKNEVFPIPLR
ncbi:hypothetical protein CPB85DRAFT_1322472 [Mucidula mucida]|nr:hypothetical protein CPB85DRAFT_1322472 [Mucidula mucida]